MSTATPNLVYFSSASENTHRFVERVGIPAVRIPLHTADSLRVDEPFVLIVPTYGEVGTFWVGSDPTRNSSPDRWPNSSTIRTTALCCGA